jgi:hypothetical protein
MRLGIIARSDNTGLGNQTRELVNMLNPDKIMLINSSFFNQNKQHPEWYSEYNCQTTRQGFPNTNEVSEFLKGLDVVISCELFYSPKLVNLAKSRGIKTILQYNYEFLDYLANPNLTLPDVLVSPSLWNFEDVVDKFGDKTKVVHLPPPTNINLFSNAKEINTSKTHKRLLHIAGKAAVKDRNGTNTVIEMLNYSIGDYELVIKTQSDLEIKCNDPRLTIDTSSPDSHQSLYEGFDAMILPRRYAGLSLPMNEALLSGLPVFMTDVSPNNILLPSEWLVRSSVICQIRTKTMVDVYEADAEELAALIDNYINSDKVDSKVLASNLSKQFLPENLKQAYLEILGKEKTDPEGSV